MRKKDYSVLSTPPVLPTISHIDHYFLYLKNWPSPTNFHFMSVYLVVVLETLPQIPCKPHLD